MSDKTGIEWADATWNPVTGCNKVSEGCRNCYAKTFTERFEGTPGHYFETGFKVTLRPDKLDQPLKWNRPRRIFVNSMSDLFHEYVPLTYITEVFKVMAEANWHTFQLLTKRPSRMEKVLRMIRPFIEGMIFNGTKVTWPLPNLWIGVSVENQKAADERIPLLLNTPAEIRFLSCEPLLGQVDIQRWLPEQCAVSSLPAGHPYACGDCDPCIDPLGLKTGWNYKVNWVIAGGESGPGARPMHPDWASSLRDQCQAAGVPFFFKQWGEWHPLPWHQKEVDGNAKYFPELGRSFLKLGKKQSGRLLDFREWNEFPEVMK